VTVLRALRVLVLGETWTLPCGVLAILAAGAVLREIAPRWWSAAGGFVLLTAVVAVLSVSVAREAAVRRKRS